MHSHFQYTIHILYDYNNFKLHIPIHIMCGNSFKFRTIIEEVGDNKNLSL